jgi:hypothetical protein
MNTFAIRPAGTGDVRALCALEESVWGGAMGAGPDKWESRIRIFPEGTLVAAENGRLVGVVVAHIIAWPYRREFPDWEGATDNGYIRNHDPDGEVLYGVDLTVRDERPGVAERLMRADLAIADRLGLRAVLGSRIPSLRERWHGAGEPGYDDVVRLVRRDPTVRFFGRLGFRLMGVKPAYFAVDEASFGWGAMIAKEPARRQ